MFPSQYQAENPNQEFRSLVGTAGQFGHMPHLAGLTPVKPDHSARTTNPREIEAILEDSTVKATNILCTEKLRVTPVTAKKVSLFYHLMKCNQ